MPISDVSFRMERIANSVITNIIVKLVMSQDQYIAVMEKNDAAQNSPRNRNSLMSVSTLARRARLVA